MQPTFVGGESGRRDAQESGPVRRLEPNTSDTGDRWRPRVAREQTRDGLRVALTLIPPGP